MGAALVPDLPGLGKLRAKKLFVPRRKQQKSLVRGGLVKCNNYIIFLIFVQQSSFQFFKHQLPFLHCASHHAFVFDKPPH